MTQNNLMGRFLKCWSLANAEYSFIAIAPRSILPGVVAPNRVLSIGQIKLNWVIWNRMIYMFKNGFGISNLQWLMCHKTKPNQNLDHHLGELLFGYHLDELAFDLHFGELTFSHHLDELHFGHPLGQSLFNNQLDDLPFGYHLCEFLANTIIIPRLGPIIT